MRESKLTELKQLADRLIVRDVTIKRSICDIYEIIKDDTIADISKLDQIKQIIKGCQPDLIKMAGTSIHGL